MIRPVSEASYGTYLVHILVLVGLAEIVKLRLENPWAIVSLAVSTFVVSSVISLSVRKIPKLGKWLVG